MSTWTTPATWANGAVTAATMNTEIRDHLNFLKGALDLITNSTAADTGAATQLSVTRATAAADAYSAKVSGDTQLRFNVNADGSIEWGSGSAAADFTLYRRTLGISGAGMALGGTGDARLLVEALGAGGELGLYDATAGYNSGARLGMVLASGTTPIPTLLFSRESTTAQVNFRNDADGRVVVTAPSDQPRFGVSATSAADTHLLFTWVEGDTQPRISMGINGSGQARLAMGGGGSTAPDVLFYRTGAKAFESDDTFIRIVRAAVGNGALVGRVAGDGSDQFTIYARGHGQFLDGISTLTKSGAVTDADFRSAPPSGTIAVDTTNFKIYVRMGATWKSTVALT